MSLERARFRGEGSAHEFREVLKQFKQEGCNLLVTGAVSEEVTTRATATLLGTPTADRKRVVMLPDADDGGLAERLPTGVEPHDPDVWVIEQCTSRRSAPCAAAEDQDDVDVPDAVDVLDDLDRPDLLDQPDALDGPDDGFERTNGGDSMDDAESVADADGTDADVADADVTDDADQTESQTEDADCETGNADCESGDADVLADLERELLDAIAYFEDSTGGLQPAELRLSVSAVGRLVHEYGEDEVVGLLRTVGAAVRGVDGMAHYHLPRPDDDELVGRLDPLFDARIELRKRDGLPTEQRWHVPAIDRTTNWVRL